MSDVGEQEALLETLRSAGRIDHVSDRELDRRARRHRRAMTRLQRRERLSRLVRGRRRVVVVCLAAVTATAVGVAVGSGVLDPRPDPQGLVGCGEDLREVAGGLLLPYAQADSAAPDPGPASCSPTVEVTSAVPHQ